MFKLTFFWGNVFLQLLLLCQSHDRIHPCNPHWIDYCRQILSVTDVLFCTCSCPPALFMVVFVSVLSMCETMVLRRPSPFAQVMTPARHARPRVLQLCQRGPFFSGSLVMVLLNIGTSILNDRLSGTWPSLRTLPELTNSARVARPRNRRCRDLMFTFLATHQHNSRMVLIAAG